jgi:hypothetical protein
MLNQQRGAGPRGFQPKGEDMKHIKVKRNLYVGATLLALIVALGVGQAVLENRVDAQGRTVQAPMFEVDPLAARHDDRRVGRRPG